MLNSIDLANYDGPLRCYVVRGEHTITVFFKLGTTIALDSSCLKLRFRSGQYEMLRETLARSPDYPGVDLAANLGGAWADLQSETEAIDGDQVL